MPRTKISGEARKVEITIAARREFAKKGFYGTSIRDIAKAAKVSEALIYRHFKSKEALYKQIYFYIDTQVKTLGDYFTTQESSTKTLFRIVNALTRMIMMEMPGRAKEQKLFERLLVYSLLENTSFAKYVFHQYDSVLMPIWESCMNVALKQGDLYEPIVDAQAKMWLSHHLIMAANFLQISGESLFPYKKELNDLLDGMVIFILRGMGLTDEAIRAHYALVFSEDIIGIIFSPEPAK